MDIVYIGPDKNEFQLKQAIENVVFPVNAKIKISNCNEFTYDGKPYTTKGEEVSFDYCGEPIKIEGENANYSIKSLSIPLSQANIMEYLSFNTSLISGLPLNFCTFDREIESIKTDNMLGKIFEDIVHIKQVFMRPKIHLKDDSEILPVEVVTRIGHETVKYLASHSEHWEARRATGLAPSRLLARTLEDEYAIYENVVAKNLVDKLYKYASERNDKLKEIEFYGKESFAALNNENDNVLKAQGELYKGYLNTDNTEFDEATKKQREYAEEIISILTFCKETSLYRKLRKVGKITTPLKLTNIFMMDKHYKYIYKLWNEIIRFQSTDNSKETEKDISNEYSVFCRELFDFALKNYNFISKGNSYIFKDWICKVENIEIDFLNTDGFIVTMNADNKYPFPMPETQTDRTFDFVTLNGVNTVFNKKPTEAEIQELATVIYPKPSKQYDIEGKKRNEFRGAITEHFQKIEEKIIKILFVPYKYEFSNSFYDTQSCIKKLQDSIVKSNKISRVDYCYIISPNSPIDSNKSKVMDLNFASLLLSYPNIVGEKLKLGTLPISIGDINSFRRFTKALLLAMVDLDDNHKKCPLCGYKMREEAGDGFVCDSCNPHFRIRETQCVKCKNKFINTKFNKPDVINKDEPAFKIIRNEISNGFKNITDVDIETQANICPHCAQPN